MNISDFKKLEDSIKDESFSKEYKNINIVMFFLSIFGHISSIFLAYFMVSKILSGAITNNPILVFMSSVILLAGLELLKRDIFQKFSSQSIKLKTFTHKNVLTLMLISIAVVSLSFYATISGAKDFSSKSKEIEVVAQTNNKIYEDSLSNVYNTKIQVIELDSKTYKSKIDQKDNEQTSIESLQPLSLQQRNRVSDLKKEKEQLRLDIVNNDSSISVLKRELDSKVKEYENTTNQISSKAKDENKDNSLLFVVISSLIELIILAGVYFNRYYKIISYNEYKIKTEKDPNYQRWVLCESIIDVIYNQDTKINDRIPSIKSIMDISKLNGFNLLQKDAIDFLKILSSLNIIRTSGGAKYFLKSKETAKDIVRDHFNIK